MKPFFRRAADSAEATHASWLQTLGRLVRRRRTALAFLLVAVGIAPPLVFWAAVLWSPNAPDAVGTRVAAARLFVDRNGDDLALLTSDAGDMHLPIEAGDTGRWLGDAVVAIEDHRFGDHHGVDWHAATAAAWDDLIHLRVRRGASTIPMQVIRLRDPAPRSALGKIKQAVRATQLMRVASREAVLLEYLNRAPFGGNLVGVGAASRHYFAKRPGQLTLAEAATLAGIPQNPNGLRPDRFPDRAAARRDLVLDRMLVCGKITADEYAAAVAEPLSVRPRPLPQNCPGAVAATLLPTLARMAGGEGGVIRTTFDSDLQRTTSTLLREHLASLPAGPVDLAAAAVLLDTSSGECLAAASVGRAAGAMDLTVRQRSTGSTLKPFIYAAAFADGQCGPGTLVSDVPRTWSGYAPRNMDRAFGGRLTAAAALAQSRNLPAMDLLSRVGVGRVTNLLQSVGMRGANDPSRYGLTLAVGGIEASPMEVAGAFAALGRGGRYRPTSVRLPLPLRGEGKSEAVPLPEALPAVACAQVLRALSGEERTAAVCADARRLLPAWKTGTSSGQRDAWCAAVTAERTVVVWIGDPASQGDSALVGVEAAAPAALRLLVAASPAGLSREVDLAMPAVDAVESLPPPARRFAILSPVVDQQVILDPTVPAARQRVRLRATGGRVFWFAGAEPLAAADGDAWWSPTPGTHVLRAVADSGETAVVRVRVTTAGN